MTVKVQQIDQCRWRIPREGAMRTDGLVFASAQMMQDLRREQALEQVVQRGHAARHRRPVAGHAGHPLGLRLPDRRRGGLRRRRGGDLARRRRLRHQLRRAPAAQQPRRATQIRPELDAPGRRAVPQRPLRRRLVPAPISSSPARRSSRSWSRARPGRCSRGSATRPTSSTSRRRGVIAGRRPGAWSPRGPSSAARPARHARLAATTSSRSSRSRRSTTRRPPTRSACAPARSRSCIHTGTRGFGYQVCDDYLEVMLKAARKYGIDSARPPALLRPARPSDEAQRYLAAMACAANFAFANRQMITAWVRETFEQVLRQGPGGAAAAA